MTKMEISRRQFVVASAAVGGGLMIGFSTGKANAAAVSNRPWEIPTDKDGVEINAWLTIDPEGIVTVRVPHTELGQGALTSVPMMVAEELDVPWANIRAVFASANRHVNNGNEYVTMGTGGSNVVRTQHPHIMQAGASARERLKEAAALAWGVARADVVAKQGMLTSGNHTGTYGEFAEAAAAVSLDVEPELKNPSDWWLLGQPTNRLEIEHKVNGSAQYAIDTRIDGLCYAAVKACPVPWGALKSYNADAVRDLPGVIAVVEFKALAEDIEGSRARDAIQNGVAVVADSWFRAKTALDLLPVEWDAGASGAVSSETVYNDFITALGVEGEVDNETGTALDILAATPADKLITATYYRPFETHARMEPINATVDVQPDRIDVWSPVQGQDTALRMTASQTGRDTKDVFVHTIFLGGAFGGGGGGGTAATRQAAELSMQLGRPVKVIWSREEDILNDKQRAPVANQFTTVLGGDGLPTAFFSRTVGLEGNIFRNVAAMPYLVPNRRHEITRLTSHIPVSSHRAPGGNQNAFMIESFIDEIALAGGWDPLEWRLKMTEGLPSWQLVLNTLKDKAGFRTDLPKGEGMGLAVAEDHGSICGVCATVTVSRRGQLTVEKLTSVIDSGYYINPLNCAEQLEGAACWEMSHALYGGLDVREGRITNTNFDTYPVMRMNQMPQVEAVLAPLAGENWGGLGEPGGPPVPGAIGNAIFFATGKRVRSTPFKAQDLAWS